MRKIIAAAAALGVIAPAATGFAQDAERYRLEKSESGYVRMDTRTGEMSVCKERSGQLVCTLAADERAAYQDEMENLRDRVDALEARVAALEQGGEPQAQDSMPSDEEFERSLGLMERFFRRFMDIVRDLEKDFGTSGPQEEPAPERT